IGKHHACQGNHVVRQVPGFDLQHRLRDQCQRKSAADSDGYQAAMIPVINSLFAVGLVSLPGMMTGQILSGISPLIAARYQIVVMCMIFAASGISTALFLAIIRRQVNKANSP
ncbi:MAG: ABC transporter permease, partial [Halioglobus sp.]|nr:ABC transporter permease [Halioglobus sp.]